MPKFKKYVKSITCKHKGFGKANLACQNAVFLAIGGNIFSGKAAFFSLNAARLAAAYLLFCNSCAAKNQPACELKGGLAIAAVFGCISDSAGNILNFCLIFRDSQTAGGKSVKNLKKGL